MSNQLFSVALILLSSSGFMILEEKKRMRTGKPFLASTTARTVYQATYAGLMLLAASAAIISTAA